MGIVRPVMEAFPHAWVFFIPFILVATFTMLNLFIGIIVNTMQALHEADRTEDRDHIEQAVHADTAGVAAELAALRREVAALRAVLNAADQPKADSRDG